MPESDAATLPPAALSVDGTTTNAAKGGAEVAPAEVVGVGHSEPAPLLQLLAPAPPPAAAEAAILAASAIEDPFMGMGLLIDPAKDPRMLY